MADVPAPPPWWRLRWFDVGVAVGVAMCLHPVLFPREGPQPVEQIRVGAALIVGSPLAGRFELVFRRTGNGKDSGGAS